MVMSFYEGLFLITILFILFYLLTKWKKTLLLLVTLEFGSLLILGSFFLWSGSLGSLMLILMTFFVGEALMLLSSLFVSLRLVGAVYGGVYFR